MPPNAMSIRWPRIVLVLVGLPGLAACRVGVGVAIIVAREAPGPAEPLWPGPAAGLHLASAGQRAAWIAASLSAGF
jgi:hypothetical protein